MNWYIGQKVVRIAGTTKIPHNTPLTISILVTCPICGRDSLGVEEFPNRLGDPDDYSNCDCGFDFGSKYWLSYPHYFRPIEEDWAEQVLKNSLPKHHPVFGEITEKIVLKVK